MSPTKPNWRASSTVSAAGLLSQFDAPYAVSKHAAVAFAEWLSITYGDRGIRVSCLCPGAVDTPLLRAETDTRRELMSFRQPGRPCWRTSSRSGSRTSC